MPVGPNTLVVDGQRFGVPTGAAYNPVGYGQLVQLQPVRNLNQPPMVGVSQGGTGSALGTDVVGGYGTAGNNAAATQNAMLNPWNLRHSPTVYVVVGLIVALTLLKVIHWRSLASGSEKGHIGPARESAEAGV
jgi:hypothetical protein